MTYSKAMELDKFPDEKVQPCVDSFEFVCLIQYNICCHNMHHRSSRSIFHLEMNYLQISPLRYNGEHQTLINFRYVHSNSNGNLAIDSVCGWCVTTYTMSDF